MRAICIAATLILWPVFTLAQSPVYTLNVYVAGASVAQQSYPLGTVTCNQDDPGPGSNINPTKILWDDPANAGKVCQFTGDSATILSRPIGNYEGALTLTTPGGVSAESSRIPFSVAARPAAPTGLRFTQ